MCEANFDVAKFEHIAFYNQSDNRIEMHLASNEIQSVEVAGECIEFQAGERILTEYSYKYSLQGFADLAREAGLISIQNWVDGKQFFSLQYYEAR